MLEIKNLSHSFGERILYKDVNLKINKGDKIGLVGENGSGKTTLINMLSGKLLCDSGDIIWDKRGKVGYLDQFVEIDREQTVYQYLESAFIDLIATEDKYNNINELLSKSQNEIEIQRLMKQSGELFDYLCEHNYYSIQSEIAKVSSGLGITSFGMDTQVKGLSGGQRVKLMFAKLLLEQPDLLILDEPTNFLDIQYIEWLKKFLQEYKGSFLIVSHDIPFLNDVVNKIWAIDLLSINEYHGNYNKYIQIRDEKINQYNKLAQSQKEQEEKLKDYIARNSARTATAKQAKSRAKVLQKLQENKVEEIKESKPPEIVFPYKKIDNTHMIVVKNLSVGYDKPLVDKITFTLLNGAKIRISGFNGVGKTTLLKTILGQLKPICGTININKNVVFGYYEQDHLFTNKSNTAIDEVAAHYPKMTTGQIRSILAKAGLSTKKQMQPISSLSGGEQCKIQLCLMMQEPSNLLILDEPTNHLDALAKTALAHALNNYPGGVIFVSHEDEFAKKINNHKEINLAKI